MGHVSVAAAICGRLRHNGTVVVRGVSNRYARAEILKGIKEIHGSEVWELDGDGHTHGYLAGFEPFLLQLLEDASRAAPTLIARHEQTLKRVWPFRTSAAFRLSCDLTHRSGREERTRFYHHEYQNKLLVGLTEFAIDILSATERQAVLFITNADRLPPTSRSLLETFRRLQLHLPLVAFVAVDGSGALQIEGASLMHAPPLSRVDFEVAACAETLRIGQRELLYSRSGGDPELGAALLTCVDKGLNATDRLSAEAIVDLRLAAITPVERLRMGETFVAGGCTGDAITRRNAVTLPPGALDDANEAAHTEAMARYRAGEGPLVLAHALAIHDRVRRVETLVEPCEILMGIGLYDTWFSFFAEIFADPELQAYGSGNDSVNGLFINAAFVLYAMGYASAALPFLDTFLKRFPNSRFVPTALYAQSMTYGRYQSPVNLPRAEEYAIHNLALIDAKFSENRRYVYIRAFAENAYAYIKARQGLFDQALVLCERGITETLATYGEDYFKLHRSILIYNTSQVYELVGDWVQAEKRLRDAIACDPFYAEYHNDLGNLIARFSGREDEAFAEYRAALDLSPPYYEAHLNRGMLRAKLEDLPGAESDFRRVLEIKPCEWRALRELGNLKLVAEDVPAALHAYDAALLLETEDADLHANTGLAASALGDASRAIRHAEAALSLNHKHAGAHNNLAAELTALGRPLDALPHARLAAKYGNDLDYNTNLATIESLCTNSAKLRSSE